MTTRVPFQPIRKLLVTAALIQTPALAEGVTVRGNAYPETVEIEEKVLQLVGAGLRGNWLFNAYTMGAYSESGRCDAAALIRAGEVKYLRIDLLRDLSGDRMADALRRAFLKNLPADASPELKAQIETFLSYFRQDLVKGGRLELTYLPEVGTRLERNGKQVGDVTAGKAFAELLWSCYFSSATCCPDLKSQILSCCQR